MAAPPAFGSLRADDTGAASAPGEVAPKAVWVTVAALGALLVAYLVAMVLRRDWQFSPLLDGWLVVVFQTVACALCIASGLRQRRHRRVSLVMGAACVSWTVGDLLFTIESLGGRTPPTPSLANGFFLAFFPLAVVAVFLFVRGEVTRGNAPNWLDGVIAALGMGALCSAAAFRGIEHLVEHASLDVAANLVYPIADLLLLGIVVGSTIFVGSRRRAALVLIAIGVAINAAGDTINFVQPANGASRFSAVLNAVAWPSSILLFAIAMWVSENGSDRFALQRLSGFAVPGLLACSSLALLIVDAWYHFGVIAICLAGTTLVFAGVRLAFRPALRLARQQLRSSEERYRLLFEQNPLPMVTYDRLSRQIVAASNAMVASYGYSREDLQAMTVDDLEPVEDGATPPGLPGAPALPVGYTARHRRKDGTVIDVDVTSENVMLDGRECGIALYNDVTERNRMASEAAIAHDRAVEASNMKSAFLANVSHEVRTPMNGVIGMTELLLEMDLGEEQRECAEQVARSSGQMLELINDILDLSKIETGHLALDIANFELLDTIAAACKTARALAKAKGLTFELQIADDVPASACGDGRRLQQILANLLSNAVKFTADGAIAVRVDATATPSGSTTLDISVADSGIGIEAESLQRMFEPFTQADVSTTRLYGGTGLGLAIAREIVELMGGEIDAVSTPGAGSTFSFAVELAAPIASSAVELTSAAAASWSRSPLVLVAEDSPVNQIVARRVLERCGCRVEVVADGIEALKALAARHYDAVVMDCQMPVMDGYEATRELRRREQAGEHTPVIAMTAHAMTGDRERCIDAGMDDYISKPVRHADLADVLQRWIATDAPAQAA
jgi:PAS domain S-box-containing protein